MATTTTTPATASIPKGRLWTGRIISWLCILFLVFDASMKIILERHSVEGSAKVGWSEGMLQPLGSTLLICTILYAIPRTAILGAILLTAYLGGATAENIRAGFPLWFSVIFGILVWLGIWLRDHRLRAEIPIRR